MTIPTSLLKEKYSLQLKKSVQHLEHSYQKATKIPLQIEKLSSDDLEIWEGLTARFSRVVELFLSKYLRFLILEQDPGFDGFLRDYLNAGEKLGFIHNTQEWLEFRGVRNRIAHEYLDQDLEKLFAFIYQSTPTLIREIKKHAPF